MQLEVDWRLPPQGDAEGPDLHLPHSTASSKVTCTTTSPSALVEHLNDKPGFRNFGHADVRQPIAKPQDGGECGLVICGGLSVVLERTIGARREAETDRTTVWR